jgi:DNA invertase Pin-like site-specific DNA recombinase
MECLINASMPSYVIYARKSTESEDQQVLSIESQIHEMKALAERHRIGVGEILTESRSAKAPGRPVFGTLMRRVRKGEVNGIFCWKMDRLARNHYDTGQVLQALADKKLERIVTSDGVKTSDSNDRLLGTFEFALATKYIDDLRQNVLRGNRARFEKGWPNFRPPTGYLEDRVTKTIIRDPDRFDLIRRVWDFALKGMLRPVQILEVLNGD